MFEPNDIEQAIREYLPEILHMSLATSADNKPWVCEVHFSYDDDLNIYWRSKTARRHSEEIAKNPQVAGNIVIQHVKGEKPRAVYFEGTAEIMNNVDENHQAYTSYCERMGVGPEILEDAKRPDGHKFYKITVSDFYIFDVRTPGSTGKYHLPWKAS